MGILKQKVFKVILHVMVWMGVFVLVDLSLPVPFTKIPHEFHIKLFLSILVASGIYYLNVYLLIPRLLFRKKVGAYMLTLFIVIGSVYVVNLSISHAIDFDQTFKKLDKYFEEHEDYEEEDDKEDVPTMIAVFAVILGVISSFASQHYKREEERKKIEQDRIEAELAFLKNQVNPHLFFNTLNNIYALIQIDQEKARKTVLQLSQIMRYVLYDSDNPKVYLKHELDFMREYIGLMKIRLNEKSKIVLDIEDDIDQYIYLPPLIFIAFVENAFKHGVNNDGIANIQVAIYQVGQDLYLNVDNTKGVSKEKGGVGLANVRKRLQLIYDADDYHISINDTDEQYMVELRIKV